jgi:hypothetical protein
VRRGGDQISGVRYEHMDQPSLDPEVSARDLIPLECTGEAKTHEV